MNTRSPRILVVEDDVLLSDLLVRKLTDEKFEVAYAATGEAALDILKTQEKPDIILLDIILPGIDGFEVLKQIKANVETNKILVVILSNLGQESDIAQGKQLGAVDFIVKVSLTLEEVVRAVRTIWQTRHEK